MCFTYEVLETFCNLPILADKPKNSLHRTPHFPMTLQRAHPTAPRSRLFTPLHPCRSMMPGTHRPATPHPCLFATLHLCRSMAPCAYRPTAPYLCHAMLPSPTPLTVPRQVRLAPLGTAPELPEVWKQKSDQNCNFFAIGNCRRCPNHGSSPENEANDRSVPHFHFTGDEKEPLIAKMLQKRQDFYFRKANYRNRSRFRNETIAKRGQIPR